MTRIALLASCLVAAITFCSASLLASPQEVHTNENYRFSLQSPADGWSLMDREAASKIVPNALAGLSGPNGVVGFVVVEQVGEADLAGYTRMILDGASIMNRKEKSFEEVEYQGVRAIRSHQTGEVGELSFRFVRTVFLHQGWGYQLIIWGLTQDDEESDLEPFFDGFTLLPGPVQLMPDEHSTGDASGVGWRVKNGVFQSATAGLELSPSEEWRLIVGMELTGMNNDALVGLQHRSEEHYLILLSERSNEDYSSGLIQSLLNDTQEALGAEPDEQKRGMQFLGKELAMSSYSVNEGLEMRFLHGAAFASGQVIQTLSWWIPGSTEEGERIADVQEVLDGLRVLDDKELTKLQQELASGLDSQNVVGTGYCVRGGVFHDFEHGLRWSQPEGLFVLEVGMEAQATNPDATLIVEDPVNGVFGMLIIEPAMGWESEDFHELVSSIQFPSGADSGPLAVDLNGVEGFLSVSDNDSTGIPLTYCLTSTVHGGFGIQFVTWGTPKTMREQPGVADRLLKGLTFHEVPSPSTIYDEHGYRDLRMGYRFSAPLPTWIRTDETPDVMASLGSIVAWTTGESTVVAASICGPYEAHQVEGVQASLVSDLPVEFRPSEGGKPVQADIMVGGLPGTHLVWSEPYPLEMAIVLRNRTVHALTFTGSEAEKEITFPDVLGMFSFVD